MSLENGEKYLNNALDKANDIKDDIKDKAGELKDDINDKAQDLRNNIGDLGDDLRNKGNDLKEKLTDKINMAENSLGDQLGDPFGVGAVQGQRIRCYGNQNVTDEVSDLTMKKCTKYLEFFGKYFDVDFSSVLAKCIGSLNPINKEFHNNIKGKVDLYGPFWIWITIIILCTIVGNYTGYLDRENKEEEYIYDFSYLYLSFFIIFGFGIGVPLALNLLGKFVFQANIKFFTNLCIYGYSFLILIPVLLICCYPNKIVTFVALIYFLAHTCAFLFFNVFQEIETNNDMHKYIILGILGGTQVLLFFIIRKFILY